MGCGCNKNSEDCGCGCSDASKQFDRVWIKDPCKTDSDAPAVTSCESTMGLMYDSLTEDFVVPQVGKEAYAYVCEAKRWKVGQFIAINIGNNKIAAFKITSRGAKKILLLNGCDKSGVNPIFGNPDVGSIITKDSVAYPIAPTGCESDLAQKIIDTLEQFGTDAVMQLIADSTNVCLTNVPEISEDEEVHAFGGTKPDCDCAPEGFISSCFRKVLKIVTGNAGRTWCFPEMPTTNVNPVNGVEKRITLIDNNNCLKKGPTIGEFQSCGSYQDAGNNNINAVNVCINGVSSVLTAQDGMHLVGESYEEDGETKNRWVRKKKDHAIISYKSTGNGGTATAGDWRIRALNNIQSQTNSLISLQGNAFTINKPGQYIVQWYVMFCMTGDCASRLVNSNNSGEVYPGSAATSIAASLTGTAMSIGYAGVIVPVGETKKMQIDYRVEATRNDTGLGRVANFGGEFTYCQIVISEL